MKPSYEDLEKELEVSKTGAAKLAKIVDVYDDALTKIANSGGRWIDGQAS